MTREPTLLLIHSDQSLRTRITHILSDFRLLHSSLRELLAGPPTWASAFEGVSAVVIVAANAHEARTNIGEIRRHIDTERVALIAAIPSWEPRKIVGIVKCGFDDVICLSSSQDEIKSIVCDSINAGVGARFPEFLGTQVKRFEEYEAVIFQHALEESNGCVSRAAAALGVGRATMYRKIRCYDIEVMSKVVRREPAKRQLRAASAL